MSELNAAASLSLDINTVLANEKISALQARLASLGITGLQQSAGDATAVVQRLESEIVNLKGLLGESNLANKGLLKDIKLMGTAFKAQLAEAKAAAGATRSALNETTKNYMTHYEMVSHGAKATGSSIKSMMEAMTTTRPGIEELNHYYAALEKVDRMASSEASAAAAMAGRRQQEVRALTATNTELQRMGQFYAEIEQKGKSALAARNVAETTRNYMTHFEEVSRGARASAASIKSMTDAMTTTRPGIEELNRYYAALEKVDKVTRAEAGAAAAMAGRRQQEVRALTATSVELQRMGEHYAKLEREGRVAITSGLVRPFEEASRAARATSNSIKSAVEAITYPHAQKSGISDYYRKQGAVEGGGQGLAAINAGVSEAELIQAQKTAAAAAAVAQAKKQVVGPTQAVTKATKEATEAAGHWSKAAYQQHAFARGLAGSLGQLWMTYGTLAPLLAGAAIGAAAKSAVNLGKEFEYQLTFVKALGGESAEAVERLGAAAKNLAKDGMFGPTEIASGMRVLAQAGLNAGEALLAIPHALDLATVGEMEMADAAVTLVGVMNAFSMSTAQIGDIGNIFAKAAAVSQVSVGDMTAAMRTASVVGEQYGASIEDTATALTLLGKVNITGTAAGTSLRNMLKELYTPLDRSAKAMKMLGLETKNADGTMRAFPDIIYDLKERLKEFNKGSQINILQEMFGERGAKEAIAMLGQTREEWNKLRGDISQSDGFMRQVAAELEATTKGSLTQAFNTLKVTMVEAFESTDGAVGKLAVSLKEAFGSTAFKSLIENIAQSALLFGKAFTAVLPAISLVGSALSTLAPVLATGAALWLSYRTALLAVSGATKIVGLLGLTSALSAFIPIATGAASALVGGTGLIAAMKMLMASLSPVAMIAIGVGSLAYALTQVGSVSNNLPERIGALSKKFGEMADKIKAANDELREQARLQGLPSNIKKDAALEQVNSLRKETEALRVREAQADKDRNFHELSSVRADRIASEKLLKEAEANYARLKKEGEDGEFKKVMFRGLTGDAKPTEAEIAAGQRDYTADSMLEGWKAPTDATERKLYDLNKEYETIKKAYESQPAKLQEIKDAYEKKKAEILAEAPKGRKPRIDRSAIFEQKDIAKLADTEYKRAMSEIEYDKKLLDLKRNGLLINENEYQRELDKLADLSIQKAIEREETKRRSIAEKLKTEKNPENRERLENMNTQSFADQGLLEEQAKRENEFKGGRDEIKHNAQILANQTALKDIAEQRRQAFEERQAQFRIEREMDPVIAEGLRARIEAGRDYEAQERSLLEQINLAGDATNKRAIALRNEYDALLKAKEAAQDYSEAQAQQEEQQRRSPMAGYQNILRGLTDDTSNFARMMEDGLGGSLDRASQSFVELATTGKTSMRSMVADILNHLAKLAASKVFMMFAEMALNAFMPTATGASKYSLSGSGGNLSYMGGGQGMSVGTRHTGGMVSSGGASKMVDPSVFNGAPRFHTGGIVPGERPIIAKEGEGVFTPEQMKALAPVDKILQGGNSVVNAPVINITINEGQQQRQEGAGNNSNSGKELARQIEGAVMNVLVREKRNGGLLATN